MKKQNNILAYTKQVFGFALISILFFACQDDDIIKNNNVEEGIPVEVKFNVSEPKMTTTVTRGLRDEEEFQINDLYLLIFDSNGKRKKGTHYYSSDELLNNENGNQSQPTHGSLNVQTTSGKSYIFAAANVNSNQLNGEDNIKEQLDAVNSIQDFKNITATLNSRTNAAQVDRTQAALVMCGTYTPKSTSGTEEAGACNIPTQNSTLDGKIILERLDSHITFNITWGGKSSKVTSFELTGWRVYNVPVKSYLLAQEQDAVTAKENDYAISSSEHKVTTDEGGKSCSFDFYMLENRKKKQEYEGRYLSSYAEREAEIKVNDKNSGIYKYVEPYATYVEIKANMELTSAQALEGKKVATVTYVIHLGGGYNDIENFESKRNIKYTYNVEINDTEDIRVEVQEDNERRPGVEGDVIDAKTKVYTLDSHYSCFILTLTKKEARDLSFMVKTPFGTVDNNSDTNQRANGDYKWIRFARSSSSNTLAEYPKNGNNLIDLFGLSDDILSQSGNDTKKFNYTVFIDEYYYNTPPAGQNWSAPYWKNFVNKENRYAILLFSPEYSKDGDSSYADAQYLITQRSIQTYYSTEKFNSDQTALGMEHVNETGAPSTAGPGISNLSNSNGYYNSYQSIKNRGNEWSKHASITTPNTNGYTFKITNDNAWSDCLSRNRDENNNGVIDPEELKWYLPTRDQLTGMFLGAESLTTPLFDADSYPRGSVSLSGDTRFHYLLSNNQKIWGEEGCSIGDRNYQSNQPKQIRCVRNLNLDMNSNNATKEDIQVGNVFTYNSSTRVFNLEQMDTKNIRGKVNGELGLHDNFSISNRPYKAFQMAKKFHTSEEGYGPWATFVNVDQNHNSLCKNYYENTNKSDKGKWRTPNQREFMIMYTQDIEFIRYTKVIEPSHWWEKEERTDYRAYTRTEWKYNSQRHFGYNDGILFLDQPTSYNISLRCVRDVDVDSYGNIIQ